jgi:hypothetical protein
MSGIKEEIGILPQPFFVPFRKSEIAVEYAFDVGIQNRKALTVGKRRDRVGGRTPDAAKLY